MQHTTTLRLGRYHVDGRIADGTRGEVYLGRIDGPHGVQRRVALKRIDGLPQASPPEQRAFLERAQLAMSLDHPAIVRLTDFGESAGEYFLAMEHVDGLSLDALMAGRGGRPLDAPTAVRIVERVAAALEHAYRSRDIEGRPLGMVHGDVRPQRVLISRDGQVKLGGFAMPPQRNASPEGDLQACGTLLQTLVGDLPEDESLEQLMVATQQTAASAGLQSAGTLATALSEWLHRRHLGTGAEALIRAVQEVRGSDDRSPPAASGATDEGERSLGGVWVFALLGAAVAIAVSLVWFTFADHGPTEHAPPMELAATEIRRPEPPPEAIEHEPAADPPPQARKRSATVTTGAVELEKSVLDLRDAPMVWVELGPRRRHGFRVHGKVWPLPGVASLDQVFYYAVADPDVFGLLAAGETLELPPGARRIGFGLLVRPDIASGGEGRLEVREVKRRTAPVRLSLPRNVVTWDTGLPLSLQLEHTRAYRVRILPDGSTGAMPSRLLWHTTWSNPAYLLSLPVLQTGSNAFLGQIGPEEETRMHSANAATFFLPTLDGAVPTGKVALEATPIGPSPVFDGAGRPRNSGMQEFLETIHGKVD